MLGTEIPCFCITFLLYYLVVANKAKASVSVAKPNTLAIALSFGGLAERSIAADCKSVGGAHITVQGFESLTRRQINNAPATALTVAGTRTAQPKPYESDNLSIRLLAVELKRRFHDLSFLQDRHR